MKKFEDLCNQHRAKFKKNWEFYCISGDAWLDGFRCAQAEAVRLARANNCSFTAKCITEMYTEEVVYDPQNGSHQIGVKISEKE